MNMIEITSNNAKFFKDNSTFVDETLAYVAQKNAQKNAKNKIFQIDEDELTQRNKKAKAYSKSIKLKKQHQKEIRNAIACILLMTVFITVTYFAVRLFTQIYFS